MPEPASQPPSQGKSLEKSVEELLAAARPLPPYEDMVIDDLTDEEERLFYEAIHNA